MDSTIPRTDKHRRISSTDQVFGLVCELRALRVPRRRPDMARFERVREVLSGPLTWEYLKEKTESGWTVVALEWQREVPGEETEAGGLKEEVPYGLRVAGDCRHLEEDPTEKEALILMTELLVQDLPFSRVAAELNRRGFLTRGGAKWTQEAVFNLLPRLVEAGPQIFSSQEYIARKSA